MCASLRASAPLLLGLGLLSLAGCGVSKSKSQTMVTGVVTLDDRPLAGARITFLSAKARAEDAKALFGGTTNAEGRYETAASPGQYKIVIVKWARKDGAPLDPAVDDPSQMELQPKGDAKSPYVSDIPTDYTRFQSTPLTRDVAMGTQTINLDLKTKKVK